MKVGDAGGGVGVEAGLVEGAAAGGARAEAEALVGVASVVGGVAGAVVRGFVLGGLESVREKADASVREVGFKRVEVKGDGKQRGLWRK